VVCPGRMVRFRITIGLISGDNADRVREYQGQTKSKLGKGLECVRGSITKTSRKSTCKTIMDCECCWS